MNTPRLLRYEQDNDTYTGVTSDGTGITVRGSKYREVEALYINAEDGAMYTELDDPESWLDEVDDENVWTW